MSFNDISARLKKHPGAKEKPSKVDKTPPDIHEVYALRARMLGVLIRDARLASGYDVETIAAQVGVHPDEFVEWEFGRRVATLPQIELLAYFLQIPISHFWATETFAKQRASLQIDHAEYTLLRDRVIGLLVRSAREESHLDLATVAQKVGISPDELAAIEAGKYAIPMTVMVSLASELQVNLGYFLDEESRVGEFFAIQELAKLLSEMSPEVRDFLASPSNHAYIHVAMSLAQMPTDALRELAGALLDITL